MTTTSINPYEKELTHSLLQGCVVAGAAISISELVSAVFKTSKPSMNFNMVNIAKVVGYTTLGVISYDMLVKYKYIKPN